MRNLQIKVGQLQTILGDPDDGVFYRVIDGEKEANDVFEVLCGGLEIEDCYDDAYATKVIPIALPQRQGNRSALFLSA